MHLKYLVVVMALLIGAFVIIATIVPGGLDRNVQGVRPDRERRR